MSAVFSIHSAFHELTHEFTSSMKFFAHPLLEEFRVEKLEPHFYNVHYVKPDSSRAASREGYFLCQGWNP